MEQDRSGRLCFTSELFDPTFALFSTEVIPTPPNSKVFSNLHKYVEGLYQSASFKSLGWFPNEIKEDLPANLRSLNKSETGEQYILEHDGFESNTDVSKKEAISVHDEEAKSLEVADTTSIDCNLAKKDAGTVSKQGNSDLSITQKTENSITSMHPVKEDVVNRYAKLQPLKTADKKKLGKQPRLRLNVVERMESMKQGPLSILHNCMNKGLKLKVWTKRHAGFRGICIGYLLAFDKHFNLAMIDVDEIYALGFESFSIEEKRQVKKRKKAAKRNRNRLNGIKKYMEETASNEIKDMKIEEATTEYFVRNNMSQDEIKCKSMTSQCAFDAADEKLSEQHFDRTIEENASLQQKYETVPNFHEHDVNFVDIMDKAEGINSTKIWQCSADSLTDEGIFPAAEAFEERLASISSAPNIAMSSKKSDTEDCFKRDETLQLEPEDTGNLTKTTSKRRNFSETLAVASNSKKPKSHVFKRRHINQLFIRGGNVALVGYEP